MAADDRIAALQPFREGLSQALQHSDQPRDWALAAQLLETVPPTRAHAHERSALLEKALRAAPDDRIVLAIWASTPGADVRCAGCGDRARALVRVEPENGAAWVPAVDQAWRRKDARGLDAAIHALAQTRRYNEHLGQALGAWRDVFRRYPGPDGQLAGPGHSASDDTVALAMYEATTTAVPPVNALLDACRKNLNLSAPASRFRDCAAAGRLMMSRSQTLDGRLMGVAIVRASHAGSEDDAGRIRTITWQAEQYAQLLPQWDHPSLRQNHQAMIESTDSEMQVINYELTIGGFALVPPKDWKQTIGGRTIEPLDEPDAPTP